MDTRPTYKQPPGYVANYLRVVDLFVVVVDICPPLMSHFLKDTKLITSATSKVVPHPTTRYRINVGCSWKGTCRPRGAMRTSTSPSFDISAPGPPNVPVRSAGVGCPAPADTAGVRSLVHTGRLLLCRILIKRLEAKYDVCAYVYRPGLTRCDDDRHARSRPGGLHLAMRNTAARLFVYPGTQQRAVAITDVGKFACGHWVIVDSDSTTAVDLQGTVQRYTNRISSSRK